MANKYLKIFLCVVIILSSIHAKGQIIINPNPAPSEVAQNLTGKGIKITNPVITGANNSYGLYDASGTNLNSPAGVFLTTGDVNNAQGPNNTEQKSTDNNFPGSALLDQKTGKTTYDATMLEFDVIPSGNNISFKFVFASEEYEEWVGSKYNDVFGFYISGPGITGEQNIAMVPGTSTEVSINTVNSKTNSGYYKKNNANSIQYDGFTKDLFANISVTACAQYHLKLIVADVSDRLWDSGVFIEKLESEGVSLSVISNAGIPDLIEGCNSGSIIFTRDQVSSSPLNLQFSLGGTCINGTDYTQIGSSPAPGTINNIIIPGNQASASVNVQVLADGAPEGAEYIMVYLINPFCSGQITDSLKVNVSDSLSASINPPSYSICRGGGVQLTATGGNTYSWKPSTGLSNASVFNPVASPNKSTVYTLSTSLGTCVAKDSIEILVSDLSIALSAVNVSCFDGSNGSIDATISNGLPPYSYSWAGPGGFTANTEDIVNIKSGTYTITVTGGGGCSMLKQINITEPPDLVINISSTNSNHCQSHNGKITVNASGGKAPYTYQWADGATGATRMGLDPGTYIVAVTDAKGCIKTATAVVGNDNPSQGITANVTSTPVTCYGGNTGTATLTITNLSPGELNGVTYLWSTGGTTSTITGLSSGFYTVTASSNSNKVCNSSFSVFVAQPKSMAYTMTTSNVACFGDTTGTASIKVTGGTNPYVFSWTTNPVSTGSSVSGLAAGSYSVTVKDSNNCSITVKATITQPNLLTASISSQTNVLCKGNATGAVTIVSSGGTPAYSYAWNTTPLQSSASASGLVAGTYSCTVTDAKKCTYIIPVTITEPAQILTASAIITDVNCFGDNSGSATVNVSGGTPGYTYSWNTTPAQFSPGISGIPAGNYQCTVRDQNSCSVIVPVLIKQPAQALTGSISSQTNVLCKGNASGSATINAAGGTSGYAYSWNTTPVQNTNTGNNLMAGQYTVTITDSKNCAAQVNVDITEPTQTLSAILAAQTNVLCKGGSTGSATVSVTGGTGSYSYLWNTIPAKTTATAAGLSAGNYTCIVNDENNCSGNVSVTITEPAQPFGAVVTQANIKCNGNADGSANVVASGGSGSYSYVWNTTPVSYSSSISGLNPGSYQVTVSDNNGCTSVLNLNATISQPPVISTSYTASTYGGGFNTSCKDKNDGSIDLTITGGVIPYTYNWTGPNGFSASTEDLTNIKAGGYTAAITDGNGCVKTAVVNLTEPAGITLTSTMTPASCPTVNNGQIAYTFTGPFGFYTFTHVGPATNNTYTYNCTNAGGCTVSNTFPGLAPGTYTLTGTNSNGCSQSLQTEITQPGTLTYSYSPVTYTGGYNISCNAGNNGVINITVGGGSAPYTYNWTGPNSFASSNEDLTGLVAGTYSLTVFSSAGCFIKRTVTLTEPPVINSSVTPVIYSGAYNIKCFGTNTGSITSAVAGGVPGYTYSWTGSGAFASASGNINNLFAGTYQLIVTDANSCSKTHNVTLTEPAQLSTVTTPYIYNGGYNISCMGTATGSITTVTNGGQTPYSFTWSGPSSFSATTSNISNLIAGTYSLNISDANGCSASSIKNLTEPAVLATGLSALTYIGGYNIDCYGSSTGSITSLTSGGQPGYLYSWTGPAGFTGNSQNLNNLIAGNYNLNITDLNGCTAGSSITLTQPPVPLGASLASPTVSGGYNIKCNGDTTGSINVSVTGGQPPLSYSWTGPTGFTSSLMDLSNLSAGTYSLQVKDTNGCTAIRSITLTEPGVFTAATTSTLFNGYNISCHAGNTGSINLAYQGGTPNYSIIWTGPGGYSANVQNIGGLVAGTYSAAIIDANNCTTTSSITLTEPDNIVSSLSAFSYIGGYNVSCKGASDGVVNLGVTGGVQPYSFAWNNSQNSQNLSDVGAGSYFVDITDKNNCAVKDSIILTEPEILMDSLVSFIYPGGNNVSCFGSSDGSIASVISGGTQPYSFNWSGPGNFSAGTKDISLLSSGIYNLVLTDANGCSNNSSIILTTPSALSIALSAIKNSGGTNISCKGNKDGEIFSVSGGGTPGYKYTWTGPGGFTSAETEPDSLPAGTYSLMIRDTNNCIASADITLTEPDSLLLSPSVSLYGTANISCFGGNNGSISINATGGSAPYKSSWTGSGNFKDSILSINNLAAGDYSLFLNDINGCAKTIQLTLSEPSQMKDSLFTLVYPGGKNISCYNFSDGKINKTISGGISPYTINWTGPGNFLSVKDSLDNIPSGKYMAMFTDANGCILKDSITLFQPAPVTSTLKSSLVNGFNIGCKGNNSGDIKADITGGGGGYSFSWSGPGGFTSTASYIDQLITGTYNLTVRDTNNCISDTSISLIEPSEDLERSAVLSQFAGGNNVSCYGKNDGYINLTVTGGIPEYSVIWRGPSGYISTDRNIDDLSSGDYSAIISDKNGCMKDIAVSLIQPDSIKADPTSTSPFCSNNTGSISLLVYGGVAPYSYSWSNGATTQNINAPVGSYTVVVTDKNKCEKQINAVINEGKSLELAGKIVHVDCYGDSTGAIDITLLKGTPPINYVWSIGVASEDITNLTAGVYTLKCTDYNGCRVDKIFTVNQNDELSASLNVSSFPGNHNISGYNKNDGYVDLTIKGGVAPYQYNWSNNSNSEDISRLAPGTYIVDITDSKGCKISTKVSLTQPPALDMPTGFSPNGDGKNDKFVVIGLEAYPDNEISIVNRWGNVIYSKKGYQNDWTGLSSAGEQLPDATYFVILKIHQGDITLTGYVDMRRQ